MRQTGVILATLCLVAQPGFADEEASNRPIVQASRYGQCYAKSTPEESYGSKGKTTVYRVGGAEDAALHTYDWYSQQIFIECNVSDGKGPVGTAVVRLGPWARGHVASGEHMAIGFNFDGRVVKEYSTLDIAGEPDNVERSVSHYIVIRQILGFRALTGNEYAFDVETISGQIVSYDPATGEVRGVRTSLEAAVR